MRVTVSEELKKYRPLTIWQVIDRIITQLLVYVSAFAFGIFGSFAWAVVDDPGYRAQDLPGVSLAVYLFMFSLAMLFAELLTKRPRLVAAIQEYWRCNQDRFWVILSKDHQGKISATGPVLSSAMSGVDGRIRSLSRGDGLYIILPFNNKDKGYAIIGENSGFAHLASLGSMSALKSLAGWRFEPTHLNIGTTNGELSVLRIIDPSGARSDEMSLSAAMRFIGGFSRQMMETRTFCEVADILLADKTRLEARAVNVEERCVKATDALAAAAKAMLAVKPRIKSPILQGAREAAEKVLAELRPVKPIPEKIERHTDRNASACGGAIV